MCGVVLILLTVIECPGEAGMHYICVIMLLCMLKFVVA